MDKPAAVVVVKYRCTGCTFHWAALMRDPGH